MQHALPIHLTPINKLRVGAVVNAMTILNEENLIRTIDRLQPMRNSDYCSLTREVRQGLLNLSLRFTIKSTGRLIEK